MPNGETPNVTHGFTSFMISYVSLIKRFTLSRLQSARFSCPPELTYLLYVTSSGKSEYNDPLQYCECILSVAHHHYCYRMDMDRSNRRNEVHQCRIL